MTRHSTEYTPLRANHTVRTVHPDELEVPAALLVSAVVEVLAVVLELGGGPEGLAFTRVENVTQEWAESQGVAPGV